MDLALLFFLTIVLALSAFFISEYLISIYTYQHSPFVINVHAMNRSIKKIIIIFTLLFIINLIIYIKFNLSVQFILWTIFFDSVVLLSIVDYDNYMLPNIITIPLLLGGLTVNSGLIENSNVSFKESLLGALIGYLLLWTTNYIYKKFRNIEGIGYGDMKMFAMIGAWFGLGSLASLLLLSSLIGIITTTPLILNKKFSREKKIPFGPSIGIASFIIFLLN
jgi:prepilin signal peptidase PulO-like enzyme (type II secretory pathway)